MKVSERCSYDDLLQFHDILKKICDKYDHSIKEVSYLHETHELEKYTRSHVIITLYSFNSQKCGERFSTNFTLFRSEEGAQWNLVLQRQPTPILNKSQLGHFYSREEAFQSLEGSRRASLIFLIYYQQSRWAKTQEKHESILIEKMGWMWANWETLASVVLDNAKIVESWYPYSLRKSLVNHKRKSWHPILRVINTYLEKFHFLPMVSICWKMLFSGIHYFLLWFYREGVI